MKMQKILMKKITLIFVICATMSWRISDAQVIPGVRKDTIANLCKDSLPARNKLVFKVKGFVQADYMLNTQEIGSDDGFLASTIVMPQKNSNSSYFSIRQSQLGLEARRSDNKLSAYVEIDLFGRDDTTAPRLRKAYITYDKWLFGQDWSNFSDLEIWPNIFDFLGANAPMAVRQIQLRYTTELTKKGRLSLSLEDPDAASITLPDNSQKWKKKALIPNFIVAYRYGRDLSYIRIAGILSPISYEMRNDVGTDRYTSKTILGGGVNLTGALYLSKLNSFKLQTAYGKGISTNNGALNKEGYDAILDVSDGNRLRMLPFFSASVAYEHWWNPKWSSVLFYSYVGIGGKSFIPKEMIKNFQNMGVNVTCQPFRKFRIGIEGHYGTLQKYGVEKVAQAFRYQLSTALSF